MKKINLDIKIIILLSLLIILATMAIPRSIPRYVPRTVEFRDVSKIESIPSFIKFLRDQQELSFTPELKDPSYYYTAAEKICGLLIKNYNIEFIIYDGSSAPGEFDGVKDTFPVFTPDGKYNPAITNLIMQESYGLYNAGVSLIKCNSDILKGIDELKPEKLKVFIGTKKAGNFGSFGDILARFVPNFNEQDVFWICIGHNAPRFHVTHEFGHFIQYAFLPHKIKYLTGEETDWLSAKITINNLFGGKEEVFKNLFSIPENLEAYLDTDGYPSFYSTTNLEENFAETWRWYIEHASELKKEALRQYAKGQDLLWKKFNFILDAVKIDYSYIPTPAFIVDIKYEDLPESDKIITSGETIEVTAKVRTFVPFGEGYLQFVPYGNKNKAKEYLNSVLEYPIDPIKINSTQKDAYLAGTFSQFVFSFPVKEGVTPEKSIPILAIYYYYNPMLMGEVTPAYSEVVEIPIYKRPIYSISDKDYIWRFYGNHKLSGVYNWPKELQDFMPDELKQFQSTASPFGEKKQVDMAWDEKNSSIWWYTSRENKSYEQKGYEIKLHSLSTDTYELTSIDLTGKPPWIFPKEEEYKGSTLVGVSEPSTKQPLDSQNSSNETPQFIDIKPISISNIVKVTMTAYWDEIIFIEGLEEIDMKANPLDGVIWAIFKIYLSPDSEISYRLLALNPEDGEIKKQIIIPSESITPNLNFESKHWLIDPINNLIWINCQNTGNLYALSMETGELIYKYILKLDSITEFSLDPEIERIWICGNKYPQGGVTIKALDYQGNEEFEISLTTKVERIACNTYDHSLWIFLASGEIIKYDQYGNVLFTKQAYKGFEPGAVGKKKYFYNVKPIHENGSIMVVIKGNTPDYPVGDYLEAMYRYDLRRYSVYGNLKASSQDFIQTLDYTGYYLPVSDILGEQK